MKKSRGNSLPFIILFIVHTSMIIFTFTKKKKDRKSLLLLLFSNIGFAYLFEYIVLNLFKGYRYKPNLLKNRHLDNIFGAILSQAVFVPFTSLFITAFNLGLKYKIGFTLYFALIEKIFLKLKIYKNYWWKTLYTSLVIPCYFMISDFWYKHLKKGTPYILFVSLFNCIMVTGVNILYVLAVVRKFKFGLGLFHSWKEHFKIAPLYSILLSLVATCLIWVQGWLAKISIFLFAILLDLIIKKKGIVKSNFDKKGINILVHFIMIFLSNKYKHLIDSHRQ